MPKAQICIALALLQIASMVLNTSVFPAVATISPVSREISTFCGAAFSVAIALGAYFRPQLMRERALSIILLGLLGTSLALLYVGLQSRNPFLVTLGSPFGGMGMVWFSVLVGTALTTLQRRDAIAVIPLSFVASYGVQLCLSLTGPLDPLLGVAVYFTAIAGAYLFVVPHIEGLLASIQRHEPPTVLDATNPSSFLPFSSLIFITILLFNAACGFEATLPGGNLPPLELWLSFLPVCLVLVMAVTRQGKALSADSLEAASALLVLAGFLLVPLTLFGGGPLGFAHHAPALLLRSGSDCFFVLTYFMIASVGARNPLGSLTTSASALAASWVGIGCGATLMTGLQALAVQNPELLILGSQCIAFAFVAYIFVALKKFSFEQAIADVVPLGPIGELTSTDPSPNQNASCGNNPAGPDNSDRRQASHLRPVPYGSDEQHPAKDCKQELQPEDALFLQACKAVSAEYGLTARENDVLELLARGRTSPVIQKRLVVSQNTVKSHVRHIYAKMGVHSQQELIDVVERTKEGTR